MIAVRQIDAQNATVIMADPPDDAPEDVREGIARRNVVAMGGTCPCGAQMVLPPRAERRRRARLGEIIHVRVEHENVCPAVDSNLRAALARWAR